MYSELSKKCMVGTPMTKLDDMLLSSGERLVWALSRAAFSVEEEGLLSTAGLLNATAKATTLPLLSFVELGEYLDAITLVNVVA